MRRRGARPRAAVRALRRPRARGAPAHAARRRARRASPTASASASPGAATPASAAGRPATSTCSSTCEADERFLRDGDDLVTVLDVPAPLAALGATLERPVARRRRRGRGAARHAARRGASRVGGKGMPRLRRPGRHGDLRVVVNVVVPRKLSKDQRALPQELADSMTDENLRTDESLLGKLRRAACAVQARDPPRAARPARATPSSCSPSCSSSRPAGSRRRERRRRRRVRRLRRARRAARAARPARGRRRRARRGHHHRGRRRLGRALEGLPPARRRSAPLYVRPPWDAAARRPARRRHRPRPGVRHRRARDHAPVPGAAARARARRRAASTSAAARACSRSPRRSWAGRPCSASTTSASRSRPPLDNAAANGVAVQARRHDLLRDGPAPGAPDRRWPTCCARCCCASPPTASPATRARRARRQRAARARGRRGRRGLRAPRPARDRAPPRRRVGRAAAAALGSADERTRGPDLPQRRGHVRRVALPSRRGRGARAVRRHGPRLHGHPRGPAARLRRALRRRRPRGAALRLPPLRRLHRHAAPAAGHRPPAGRLPRRRRLRAHAGGHRRAADRALRHVVLGRPRASRWRRRTPRSPPSSRSARSPTASPRCGVVPPRVALRATALGLADQAARAGRARAAHDARRRPARARSRS